MERFSYQGEVFYISGTTIADASFLMPPESLRAEIAKAYCDGKDMSALSESELLNVFRLCKENGALSTCIDAGQAYLNRVEGFPIEVRRILPIMTAAYRQLNEPNMAIALNREMHGKYGRDVFSVPLYTSVAAAYCDVGDFETAKKVCDYAYFRQGGGTGEKNELSLVYRRILKQTTGSGSF